MNQLSPDRKSRLMEIFAVEGLPLFTPLATPGDEQLTPASTVELLEEGIYEDVRSSSKVTLATSRASWIDAESRRPVIGKVTVNYVPSRLRLLRSAFNLALLTFRNRSCTVQTLAAVLFGALATLLVPDELKVVVVAQVDGIEDKGEVSKRFVEGQAHVFDAEEELTRVVLSIDVPRHIGELQRRGAPAPHMITAALDALKRILEDRSWRHASDQREALAYSLAVAAFQAGGSRAFGLDFYAGDGVEVGATTEGAQTDVEDWIKQAARGENPGPIRVTFGPGEGAPAAPLSVERVAGGSSPGAPVEPSAASVLDDLEELGADELAALEGVDLHAVLAEEAAEDQGGVLEVESDVACNSNHAEALKAEEGAASEGRITAWFPFVAALRSMDYSLVHNAARSERCADAFEHHDVVNANGEIVTRLCRGADGWWLLEGQHRTPIDPGPLKRLLMDRLMAQAAEAEEVAPVPPPKPPGLVALVLARAGRNELHQDETRQAKLPAAVECWKLTTPSYQGGRILARWEIWPDRYLITLGANGTKISLGADDTEEALAHILQAAGIEEAPAHRPREATPAPVAPPELPGEGVMKRGGGGIVRLVESYGFRLEESAEDLGAMTVHPKRRGSKPVGKIGFDGDGRLIELAWEADWSRQQIIDLGGINERRLEHWLLAGEGAYKGRNQ